MNSCMRMCWRIMWRSASHGSMVGLLTWAATGNAQGGRVAKELPYCPLRLVAVHSRTIQGYHVTVEHHAPHCHSMAHSTPSHYGNGTKVQVCDSTTVLCFALD